MKPPAGTFWIGSDHPFDLHEAYVNLRADVTLDHLPGRAMLNITADSRYRLWINGSFIARGPERCWPTSMAVDRLDVTAHLRPGPNAVAVQVYCPGYSHFAHVHRAAAGALAWLEADGQTLLQTDRGWRVRRDTSWTATVPRVSIYGTGVELRDMNLADDWQQADTAAWAAARIVQTPEGPIWASLRDRTTQLLAEQTRPLADPWQTRIGPAPAATGDPHADLRAAFAASAPSPIPATLPGGQSAIWIFDLGQSRTCLGWAEITGTGGETLAVSYAEKLKDGDLLLSDPATYCRMRPTDRFTLRPGRQRVEGFTLRGARFLIFHLSTPVQSAPDPHFHVTTQSYPLAERPLPDMGDDRLNAVARMCRTTLLACLQDGFVDSIWRESSQWLGDVVAEAFGLMALSDDPRPLRLAIDMAAEGAAADGILPSILPGDAPSYVVTDYNFAWVELLALCAAHPGVTDAEAVLTRHWPTLENLLTRFDGDRGPDGLIGSQPGRRLFLDWSPMDRAEPNLTYNLRHLHALRLAATLAVRLGRPEPWSARAAALALAIRATHARNGGWQESPGGAPASQLALSLLILTRLVPPAKAGALAEQVIARSMDPDDRPDPAKPTLASPFMHHYVFQALASLGHHAAIRQIIALRWGRWVDQGAVTTPENWDISFPDGSACHGFSAHPLGWLLS